MDLSSNKDFPMSGFSLRIRLRSAEPDQDPQKTPDDVSMTTRQDAPCAEDHVEEGAKKEGVECDGDVIADPAETVLVNSADTLRHSEGEGSIGWMEVPKEYSDDGCAESSDVDDNVPTCAEEEEGEVLRSNDGHSDAFGKKKAKTAAMRLLKLFLCLFKDDEGVKLLRNYAHTLFMQEQDKKYMGAIIEHYIQIVTKHKDSLLDIPAMVLANLCVAYIMTSQNDLAEQLMRNIEREETRMTQMRPDKKMFHLCIVNLVIGTLYCSKGHYEFGIQRVMRSLEPQAAKIIPDTWFYAKRCFLSLLESIAKHLVVIKEHVYSDILRFLTICAKVGGNIEATIQSTSDSNDSRADGRSMADERTFVVEFDEDEGMVKDRRTVRQEARLLKRIFLVLQEI